MNEMRTAPPAAESFLITSYASRGGAGQKGGTLVDETVVDLAAHETKMKDPGSYRPAECRCGCSRLPLHDRRERKPREPVHPMLRSVAQEVGLDASRGALVKAYAEATASASALASLAALLHR